MQHSSFSLPADSGTNLFVSKWAPDSGHKVNGVVQIAHGAAEHSDRYTAFAEVMANEGFVVYANDHRGHGKTAGTLENVLNYAEEDAWNKMVGDMHQLTGVIKKEYPAVPVFLFGHSMGSSLSRSYISLYGKDIQGVVLSGTSGNPGILGYMGILIASLKILWRGRESHSSILYALTFGKYNQRFKPNRTKCDWLTRDETEVDRYIADPFCGNFFTAGFFRDMLKGMLEQYTEKSLSGIPQTLPVYLLSGEKDPHGENTKGVLNVYHTYKKAGIKEISYKFYENGRHEMLHEINREEVYQDVIRWLKKIHA